MTTVHKIWSEVHKRHAYYNKDGNRLPEICIMDLANIQQRLSSFNSNEIIQIWKWLKFNVEKMINSEKEKFFLVSGKSTDIEIRMVSEKLSSLKKFREKILNEAIKRLGITNKTNYKSNILIEQRINEDQFKEIFLKFQKDYEAYGPKEGHENKFLLYSCNSITIGSVWKEIEKLGESFIFVAHSGIPHLLGFYQTTNNKNIFLTEFHLSKDPYQKYRKNSLDHRFITSINDSNNPKSPIIIDRSYTGNTLLKLKNIFPNSKTVALFPKTINSIKLNDYFVFNNKLFTKKDISLSDEEWYLRLLEKSLERKRRTIIFDLGETLMYFKDIKNCGDLSNPNNPCINNINEYLKSKKIKVPIEVIRKKLIELREKRHKTNVELGPEELVNYLAQEFKIDRDKLKPIIDVFSTTFFSSAYLDPHAKEILTKLKEKYKLGMISNSPFGIPAKYSRQALQEQGIYDLFDFMVFSSEEKIRKPDRKIFEIAFSRYSLKKEETIYIGNHPIQDMEAARNFGINNRVLTKQKDKNSKKGVLLEELPQYLCETFLEKKDES